MSPFVLMAASSGKVYPLEKDITLIGRQDLCDVHIDHKSVSKQHCAVLRRGDRLWVRDLGSTNGSHVNGKRVRRGALRVKDTLGVSGFAFKVCPGDAAAVRHRDREAGTKKLNPEELRRLQEGQGGDVAGSVAPSTPVVQVNALPDDFTPVAEVEN